MRLRSSTIVKILRENITVIFSELSIENIQKTKANLAYIKCTQSNITLTCHSIKKKIQISNKRCWRLTKNEERAWLINPNTPQNGLFVGWPRSKEEFQTRQFTKTMHDSANSRRARNPVLANHFKVKKQQQQQNSDTNDNKKPKSSQP